MKRLTFAAHWAALAAVALLGACRSNDVLEGDTTIVTLSNRADLVSGGAVLVQVTLPDGAIASHLKADVDGADVSSAFVKGTDGRILGVVKGLKTGANTLTTRADDGSFTSANPFTLHLFDAFGPFNLIQIV